jgi:hypothetical protein
MAILDIFTFDEELKRSTGSFAFHVVSVTTIGPAHGPRHTSQNEALLRRQNPDASVFSNFKPLRDERKSSKGGENL